MNTNLGLKNAADSGHPTPNHILKPHHLQLVAILDLTFIVHGKARLPQPFLVSLFRFLMVEISEVKQPASYKQMMSAIEACTPTKKSVLAEQLVQACKNYHTSIASPQDISKFFKNSVHLVGSRDEDEEVGFLERRSLFGFFVRRCLISLTKLSFEAQTQLYKDYRAWVDDKFNSNSIRIRLDVLDNSYYLFKVHADKRQFAEVDPYAWYVKDEATGDTMNAEERLRCFFEQYFHEGSDSGMRQLALLNLARMHYIHHEYPACQKLLHEAINVARSHNDRLTLQHCLGLLHRIPEEGQRPVINEIQPDLHPFEILYDCKKLMQVNSQQPLSATFDKITQVTALYDNWSDFQHHRPVPSEQWAHHAVQAIAFDLLGCAPLANIHNRVVCSFMEHGTGDNTRLVAFLNNSRANAEGGLYDSAITSLLHPLVWSGLSISDYNLWAGCIWNIFVLRASRQGQLRLYNEYLKPRRPNIPHHPREYWFGSDTPLNSIIRDPLYEVLYLREKRQAHHYVEPLLTALWHAEFQQRWGLYRVALTLLADIGLEFGLAMWSLKLMQQLLPQVCGAGPMASELKGFVYVTYARCLIATAGDGEEREETLRQSLVHLEDAENVFRGLCCLKAMQDTQYLMSTVYHNLGMEEERDAAAERCLQTEEERKVKAAQAEDAWVSKIWTMVSKLGAAIAAKT
ncbi:hypothetical protein BXZ70DRAFT_227681 [Cristinia sonorae]|uniref:Anaphase-promoting complex subunit 5 n=1 Tax=Cristinia sonorae TaxID=1940300 RepID=A0A8K0UMI2_9AGAR|nr:hypothetical protein BXZ70DRAFT_227681 [Cristinia sonorae]